MTAAVFGDDGLTDAERAELAEAYLTGPGKAPESTPERTALIRQFAHRLLHETELFKAPQIAADRPHRARCACGWGSAGYSDQRTAEIVAANHVAVETRQP